MIINQTTKTLFSTITIFMTSIFPFLFGPTMGQSTCAFLKQKYPQFIFYNVPDEPRRGNKDSRSVGEEKQQLLDCILSLFPILRPFGFGPEAISQLTGRAFRIWSSTIIALEQISRDLQILEKANFLEFY
uniref:NR LBD domain-containing protein n=1 Tax=Meloidogyne hapla TaxID=6305 RepID=A0A1I8BXK8_MELHA